MSYLHDFVKDLATLLGTLDQTTREIANLALGTFDELDEGDGWAAEDRYYFMVGYLVRLGRGAVPFSHRTATKRSLKMELHEELTYVLRLTRLEAAKALVAPKDVQDLLRSRLAQGEPIEGETVVPALPANVKVVVGPHTRKAMRRFKHETRRQECPHGCGSFKRLALHMTKAHPQISDS